MSNLFVKLIVRFDPTIYQIHTVLLQLDLIVRYGLTLLTIGNWLFALTYWGGMTRINDT